MKKISKRVLSLLMSVMMVVTMLPTFAVNAASNLNVDWTPIASSDFSSVNSVTNNTAITPSTYNGQGNTMSWTPYDWSGSPSVSNGAVYLPDGYMYMSAYNGNSVPITGSSKWKIDFGFRFKTTNSGDDEYYKSDNYSFLKMYVYTDTHENPYNPFVKNAGNCYFQQNANGVGYSWENDGHNVGARSQDTSITTGNGHLVANTNYHYVAEFTGDRFTAYITDDSGNRVQTVINTTESTFISRLNNIKSTTINAIKIGDDDNSYYFKGLEYRNITFYSGSNNSVGSTVSDLEELMGEYEDMMSTGQVYTNMAAAYKAYVDANEACDAYTYGGTTGQTNAQISSAYTALSTAIKNMQTWNHSFDAKAYHVSDEAVEDYGNVVYQNGTSWGSGDKDGQYQAIKFATPTTIVLAYDGFNRVAFPIMVQRKKTGNNDTALGYLQVTNTNFSLDKNWIGYTNETGDGYTKWPRGSNLSAGPYYIAYRESNPDYTLNDFANNTGTRRDWANSMAYVGSGNTTNYYEKITGFTYGYQVYYNSGKSTRTKYSSNNDVAIPSYSAYVINFKPVLTLKDQLANRLKTVSVSDYKEGGMLDFLTTCDALTGNTAINPKSYSYSSTESDVTTCATAIKNFVNGKDYSSLSLGTTDAAANYIALRDAIDYSGEPSGLDGSALDNTTLSVRGLIADGGVVDGYTLTGFGTLQTRYNEAVAIMAELGTSGYNTNQSSDYRKTTTTPDVTTVATAADNLLDAFDELSLVQVSAPTVSSGSTYLGPNDVITVTDTNSGSADSHKWQYLSNGSWTDGGTLSSNGGTFNPFSNATLASAGTATVRVGATKSTTTVYNNDNGITYTYFTAPTVTKGNTTLSNGSHYLTSKGETINFASTQPGAHGTIRYKIDKYTNNVKTSTGSWTDADSDDPSIVPFDNNSTDEYVELQVREIIGNNATSVVAGTFTLHRQPNLPTIESSSGTNYLDDDDTITLTDIDSNSTAYYAYAESNGYGESWGNYSNDVSYTDVPTIVPFSQIGMNMTAGYKIKAKSKRNIPPAPANTGYNSGYTEEYEFYYLTAPTVSKTGSSGTINSSDNNSAGPILNVGDTITLNHTNGFTGTIKYRILTDGDVLLQDWTNYTTAFNPFINNGATKIKIEAKQYVSETTQSGVKTVTNIRLRPTEPTASVADGTYLDNDDTVTITNSNPSATTTYDYSTDGGTTWTTGQSYNSAITPFLGKTNADGAASYKIKVYSTRFGLTTGGDTVYTYNFLSTPTMDKTANAELAQTDVVTITRTNNASQTTTTLLDYSLSRDGTNWSNWINCAGTFAPFNYSGYQSNLVLYVKVRERISNNTISPASAPVKFIKDLSGDGYYVFYQDGDETSRTNYDSTGAFFITNTIDSKYSGETVYYQATADGVAGSFAAYDITNGIPASTYANNDVVSFKFYVIEGGTTKIVAENIFLHNGNYNELAFKETFDSASASGTTLTFSDGTTATASNSGSFSVANGAGWKDSNGNSPDWRENVLKLNASSATDYNKITFNNNPIASDSNPANAFIANNKGVTLSFWRYVPAGDGDDYRNTANVTDWTPAISFSKPRGENGERYYFHITETGYTTRSDGAINENNNYNKYIDIKPDAQDLTGHATGNNRNRWVNIVVTVDPNSGVTVYTNGEPHKTTVTPGIGGTQGNYTANNAELAKDILAFITDPGTDITIGDGQGYWSLDGKDLYLDDIRIYTGIKTQVDINNMYIADDADVVTDFTSTSHDPTNVTVYTLARAVTTINGTKPAGSTVGQEFIDYYGLDATSSADVSAIDEYSFGTGMTIYHRNKTNGKWEVVGDSQGRCGYQNEELFGSEYHTALAAPLNWAKYGNTDGTGSVVGGTGAGSLVWAPHVMYNLTLDTWVYYGSTSSWGIDYSSIFRCVSSDGSILHYTYKDEVIHSSGSKPNAIDACVYYEYANNKPVVNGLHLVYGSWGGNVAIQHTTINANGTTSSTAPSTNLLAVGINGSLEGASDGGSCEGAYVVYNNGYYYLYVSYGQNTGSYVERVYRSTSPSGGFVGYNGVSSTDTSTHATHGNQILGPFDSSLYEYVMVSTGHNSVFKTVNNYGEVVSLNSVHARPNTGESQNWKPIQDNALATAQLESKGTSPNGNVNLVNQIAYTENGWPVMMPYQYDGTDTVQAEITADELEGIYAANDMQVTEYYNWAAEYTYTIIKDDDDTTNTGAYEYGTDDNGDVFKGYIKLSTGADGTRYATWYTSKAKYEEWIGLTQSEKDSIISEWEAASPSNREETTYCEYIEYIGVIGKHGNKVCVGEICTYDFEYSWTFRTGDVPKSEDVDSLGNSVSMDGVIYTHKANDTYAKYGYEISDDYSYGINSQHQGERCTTITTTYPAKIDVSNPSAVYCLSDEALCKTGNYSGGTFNVVALNDNQWYDSDGTKYSDAQAIALNGEVNGEKLKRLYGLKGYVSDYYFDSSTGKYADSGVELIVSYNDVETGIAYSEFEFCYVMANPAMAHTIQGIRNQSKDSVGANRKAGHLLYDRFPGSYGKASDIISTYTKQSGCTAGSSSTGEPMYFGSGVFQYAGVWGNSDSVSAEYNSPYNMAQKFDFFNAKVGTNSGSYGMIEHQNKDEKAYTVSSNVVDTDYYIDFSNTDNYKSNNEYGLITTNNSGVPTGYSFDFKTSNIKWVGNDERSQRWATTSYMYTAGDLKSKLTLNSEYDSSKDTYVSGQENNESRYSYGNYTDAEMTERGLTDTAFKISGLGKASTNENGNDCSTFGNLENRYIMGLGNDEIGRKVISGYFADPDAYIASVPGATSENIRTQSDYYTYGITRALPTVNSGRSNTNSWNMHITFSGKQSVSKNGDPGSGDNRAEKYANFIIEQGIAVMPYSFPTCYAISEETYAYYNIGVHTCDKGAARSFAKNYLRKKLAVTEDPTTHEFTVKVDSSTGAPIYLDAEGNETTNVDEAALLNSQDYTLASYQDYIDAVAELNWFVENPKNTTFADYKNSGSNASTEYSTAYTAQGAPIYVTDKSGNNVFKDGSTSTDEVQAKLIQNVITAYENLFERSDYVDAEDVYGAIAITTQTETNDTITVYEDSTKETVSEVYNKANYTSDSWNNFVSLVRGVSDAFTYDDKESTGETSWRYVELSGAEYRKLLNILGDADNSLMKKLDTSELDTLVTSKTTTKNGGIFTGANGEQTYTLQSWKKLSDRIETANELKTPENDPDAKYSTDGETDTYFTVGKYDVTGVTEYDFNGVKYYAQEFDGTDFNKTNYTSTGHPSPAQSAIYGELDTTDNTVLAGMGLKALDSDSAYESYDAAYAVVSSSINYDKYLPAAKTLIDAELAHHDGGYTGSTAETSTYGSGKVYIALDPTNDEDLIAAYNAATGGSIAPSAHPLLKNAVGAGTVDSYTTALLNAAGTIEADANVATYVKAFNGYVTVTDAEGNVTTERTALTNEARNDSTTFYYGDTYVVPIPEAAQGKCDISVTYTDESGKTTGSQKVSYNGDSFTKNVVSNMEVIIKVTERDASEETYKVHIRNAYGVVTDTIYVTEENLNTLVNTSGWENNTTLNFTSTTVNAPTMAFYTFSGWTYSKNDNEKTATFTPTYCAGREVTLTVNGADSVSGAAKEASSETSYKTVFDSYVTMTKSGAYGWAAYNTNNSKYQIASYGESLSLYAVTNEVFYPITKSGNEYYAGETKLTASNVDVKFTVDYDNDAILKQKLDGKKPFVSLVSVDTVENGNNKFSSGSAYCRVTTGASSYSEIGVVATTKDYTDEQMVKGTAQIFKTSTVLPTGQYSYTISSSGSGFARLKFRGYIAYDLTYSYTDDQEASHSADLNVSEYSGYVKTVTPGA